VLCDLGEKSFAVFKVWHGTLSVTSYFWSLLIAHLHGNCISILPSWVLSASVLQLLWITWQTLSLLCWQWHAFVLLDLRYPDVIDWTDAVFMMLSLCSILVVKCGTCSTICLKSDTCLILFTIVYQHTYCYFLYLG